MKLIRIILHSISDRIKYNTRRSQKYELVRKYFWRCVLLRICTRNIIGRPWDATWEEMSLFWIWTAWIKDSSSPILCLIEFIENFMANEEVWKDWMSKSKRNNMGIQIRKIIEQMVGFFVKKKPCIIYDKWSSSP